MKNIAIIIPFVLLANVNRTHGATMYVSSASGSTLNEITPNGTMTPFNPLPNNSLGGIAFDSTGNLYVANNENGAYSGSTFSEIDKITPNGAVSVYATLPQDADLQGLAFDHRGNLYVAEYDNGTVARITPDGIVSYFSLNSRPMDLAFDSVGNLFVSEPFGSQVVKITPDGAISNFLTIKSPIGLVIDSNDNLYVSTNAGNIAKVTPLGASSTYVTLSATFLNSPVTPVLAGMALDNDGNLFVADTFPEGIYMITPIGADGVLTTNFNNSISEPQFLAFAPTPEPASLSLCAIGWITLLCRRRSA